MAAVIAALFGILLTETPALAQNPCPPGIRILTYDLDPNFFKADPLGGNPDGLEIVFHYPTSNLLVSEFIDASSDQDIVVAPHDWPPFSPEPADWISIGGVTFTFNPYTHAWVPVNGALPDPCVCLEIDAYMDPNNPGCKTVRIQQKPCPPPCP